MKKKFAFLGFHVIENHKWTGSINSEDFFKNPVMLKTDRFLEKDLRNIMQLGNKRPYTLVVDTAGCNKNCWFCYAYPILKKKDNYECKTICLSEEELVKCFVDKLHSLKEKVILKDRFLSKLRITGGEPLFSDKDTLTEVEGENRSSETINYFLKFFELFDPYIEKLVKEKVIFLSVPKKYSEEIPFPTFLSTVDERIEIRFDTNGFLFGDFDFTDKFIGGIYNLFKNNKLNNLFIKIDYSLKGAHPLEVFWSQHEKLPVDESLIKDFKIEDHPQYTGLKNIFDSINKYKQKDPEFSKCFGITVEPGMNNVKGNFQYYKDSLNWSKLEKKLQEKFGSSFRISDVDNKMEIGINWSKIHTHLKRGVAVKAIFDGKYFICLPTDPKGKKEELFSLLGKLKGENKNFAVIYIPYEGEGENEKQSELNKF